LIRPSQLGKLPPLRQLQTASGKLQYILSGRGGPAILLFNGAGVTLEGWRGLYPAIEQLGTVLAWNRFGAGGSSKPAQPQTGTVVIACLRELLAHAGLQPPYVLLAHSLGGLFAQLFARLSPQEVAGVLFLEATHPQDKEMLKGHESQLAAVLGKLFALPQKLFRGNLHAEVDWIDATVRELAAAGPFPDVPLTVITGGNTPPRWLMPPEALRIRRANQADLARLSPQGRQVIAEKSGHFPQLTQPELVCRELARLAALSRP